jgi:hypothetical protein
VKEKKWMCSELTPSSTDAASRLYRDPLQMSLNTPPFSSYVNTTFSQLWHVSEYLATRSIPSTGFSNSKCTWLIDGSTIYTKTTAQ